MIALWLTFLSDLDDFLCCIVLKTMSVFTPRESSRAKRMLEMGQATQVRVDRGLVGGDWGQSQGAWARCSLCYFTKTCTILPVSTRFLQFL